MPVFETPEPLSVFVELGVGNVRITASDRTDTAVDVRPSDESDDSDVQAAQQVRVDHANGTLRVTGPRTPLFDFSSRTRSVEVSIDLPSGSQVAAEAQIGDLSGTGRLGDCRFTTSIGDARLDRTGALRVDTGAGDITADGVTGDADIRTGSGKVRIGATEASVVVRNANGDISVDRAGAGVEAKTSNGAIRVGEVVRGSVRLTTAMGDLDIGIADGTAARLAVETGFGQVRNLLDDATRPEESDETVEVHARTSFGAITIHRS